MNFLDRSNFPAFINNEADSVPYGAQHTGQALNYGEKIRPIWGKRKDRIEDIEEISLARKTPGTKPGVHFFGVQAE
jgi:hypothetical protein